MLQFLVQQTNKFKKLFKINECGKGGQSRVMIADAPGYNVVIKFPLSEGNPW